MEVGRFELTQANNHPDIIACNREGQTVLVVEVKATQLKDSKAKQWAIEKLKSYLQAANTKIPFAMLADLKNIEIFQWDGANLSESVSVLKTVTVLNHYDPEFSSKRIFWNYLKTLIEAWLRDLAYHWKLENPPASEELAGIGLLQVLEDGDTYAERDSEGGASW
ncbi:type I restriction enzyme HsdR N-terminal domain-containing protein [Trichocoleus sp. Lan]|uniref:type I restriction enzyme HsdR N-terminal domain-containing protein n=1 Tax=Trichocoleus sp. Lan TaxID=2933927 RepID=UPI0032972BED